MRTILASLMTALLCATALARDTAIYNGKLANALNANGFAITNVPAPTASGDAVNKAYVDSIGGVTPAAVTNIAKSAVVAYDTTNLTARIDARRDLTNNVCAADSFAYSAWSKENLPSGVTWDDQPFIAEDGLWTWHYTDGELGGYSQGGMGENDNETFQTFGYGEGFTSTRTAIKVAASNDTFTTYIFVTNAIANATPDLSSRTTFAQATNIASSASITNGGAKAYADALVVATNPTFSNQVLSVGLNIDTNSVAQLNAIVDGFGGFPIEGTATTVGGLLAALAAAIAWLKKNKVTKTGDEMSGNLTLTNGAYGSFSIKNEFDGTIYLKTDYGAREITFLDYNYGTSILRYPKGAGDKTLATTSDITDDKTHLLTDGAASAYASATTYAAGAFVTYQGKAYQAKQSTTGNLPTDTTYWRQCDLPSLFSSTNTSTDPQPTGVLNNTALDKGIVKVVAARCASLDPETSSIADIINALKGTN